jgi:hypothetical protein
MPFPGPAPRTSLDPNRPTAFLLISALVVLLLSATEGMTFAEDSKPTPENTIHIALATPVAPQKFTQPIKFFVGDVVDRAGNPQPMLVTNARGGIYVDRLPADIVREALESSLRSAEMLSPDAASADMILNVYLFHFGLAPSFGDFFGKVEFAVTIKNPKGGKSQQISASGTSVSHVAKLKKNAMKNLETDFNGALSDAVRNLLRGQALHDAIISATSSPGAGA